MADWIQPWPKKCPHLILSALKINSKSWPADGLVICPHLMDSCLSALKLSADTFCATPSAGQQGRPQARIFFWARGVKMRKSNSGHFYGSRPCGMNLARRVTLIPHLGYTFIGIFHWVFVSWKFLSCPILACGRVCQGCPHLIFLSAKNGCPHLKLIQNSGRRTAW